MTDEREAASAIEGDDEEYDEDEDSRYMGLEGEDEVASALFRDLVECYFDATECVETIPAILEAALRFAAMAEQVGAYEIAGLARDVDKSTASNAENMIRDCHKVLLDYLTSTEMFAATGRALGEPLLNIRTGRKLRRAL
jgi:hypothetical protein